MIKYSLIKNICNVYRLQYKISEMGKVKIYKILINKNVSTKKELDRVIYIVSKLSYYKINL